MSETSESKDLRLGDLVLGRVSKDGGVLTGWSRSRQSVRTHTRNQAYGRGWSRHRPRRIERYARKRQRRGRR